MEKSANLTVTVIGGSGFIGSKLIKKLGFEKSEGLRIPDEYLESRNFTVLRTIKGIGDWGIISAMPRLLKTKYPDCKVFIPSNKLFKKLFDIDTNIMYDIFSNNPYVDGFSDDSFCWHTVGAKVGISFASALM